MAEALALFSVNTDQLIREFNAAVRRAAIDSYPGPEADLASSAYTERCRRAVPPHPFTDFPRLLGRDEGGVAVQVRDANARNDAVPDERTGAAAEDVRLAMTLVLDFTGNAKALEYRPAGGKYLNGGRVLVERRQIILPMKGRTANERRLELNELLQAVERNLDLLRVEATLFFACRGAGDVAAEWADIRAREQQVAKARARAAYSLGPGVRVIDV